MLCLQHFQNKWAKKSNFSDEFKLDLIITYYLWFVVKMLWKQNFPLNIDLHHFGIVVVRSQ